MEIAKISNSDQKYHVVQDGKDDEIASIIANKKKGKLIL